MIVKKVLNNGEFVEDKKKYTFLTTKGYRTPQFIFVGYSDAGIEMCDITKKGAISKIERDNRLFFSK